MLDARTLGMSGLSGVPRCGSAALYVQVSSRSALQLGGKTDPRRGANQILRARLRIIKDHDGCFVLEGNAHLRHAGHAF